MEKLNGNTHQGYTVSLGPSQAEEKSIYEDSHNKKGKCQWQATI